MAKSTKKAKIIAPLVSAAVMILFLASYLGVLLYPLLFLALEEVLAWLILGLYALIVLAVIGGIIAALIQRLHEIKGGEEDAAAQY